eukprot:206328-Chlamydomonas_euryale.AAC.1
MTVSNTALAMCRGSSCPPASTPAATRQRSRILLAAAGASCSRHGAGCDHGCMEPCVLMSHFHPEP